ncbi:E3 ubiquitin-protein ligase mib2 [Desmophyllum pertusum]|uniref:E3 ubiquitin-protein ligase mib2 n=1 Tax=Desmophyllum pertusum TaxID=174260 RepID=A0A9W9ZP17_9CNID|nr:E3 ubiquitin-protein ligase mib2 [Desmophyllum pertusum]
MPSSANKLSFVEKDPSQPHGRARRQTNEYESQNESNDSTASTFSVGLRVVRGADWISDDNESDGGEGFLGTVVEVGRNYASVPEYMAVIQWDMGTREVYSPGHHGVCDLCVLDNSSVGKKTTLSLM